MASYPADWTDMRTAIARAVKAELDALGGGWTVTWEDQDGPAPETPRASLAIRTPPQREGRLGTEVRSPSETQLDILRRTSGRFTLGITIMPGAPDPAGFEAIRLGVHSIGTREALAAAGVVVIEELLAQDTSSRFSGRWDSRYALDLACRVSVEQLDENQPWIEHAGGVDLEIS